VRRIGDIELCAAREEDRRAGQDLPRSSRHDWSSTRTRSSGAIAEHAAFERI
jgi:hypothetical protein